MVGELGVLNILLSPQRTLDVPLPRTSCSLYTREILVARSYKAIPALSEGALMALCVRQQTMVYAAIGAGRRSLLNRLCTGEA